MKSFQFHILVMIILIYYNVYPDNTKERIVGYSITGEIIIDYYGNSISVPTTKDTFEYTTNPTVSPTAYYVSKDGDGGNGRSWATAWKPVNDYGSNGFDSTITNPLGINWNVLQPGDTLYIDGGSSGVDYTSSGMFYPPVSGTYENYIYIVKGQDAGHNGSVTFNRIGSMNGSSGPGHANMDSSLVRNHCLEFNGFTVTKYIVHQDEVATNNFTPNGYHPRFKNIRCDNVTEDKFFELTGHPRYIEIIDCYLRQSPTGGEQEDLIWVRGDASYTGGGLYADSIFIIGNTLISNNQASSPHSDGFQYVDVANVWTEGNKFYTGNNKTTYTQTWYGNGYTGKAWFLNNVFYISNPASSPNGPYILPNYIVNGVMDSLYWVDNTMVTDVAVNKGRWFYQPNGNEYKYVLKNNIFCGSGNQSSGLGIFNNAVSIVTDHNQWYNPGQSNVVTYQGSARTFSYMNGLAGGTDINNQPSFISFDWSYSRTLSYYENYDFNIPSPTAGTAFTTSFGGHTYISDGKIGANLERGTEPTDIKDNSNIKVINDFNLYQNFPNPFNPTTTIRYKLPRQSKVVIKIYNILGSEIMEVLNATKEAGTYEVEFNADILSSGTYIYRIVTDNFAESKKMTLLK
jgi:hypothetical protein